MTLAELKKLLEATGYPVAYSHFKEARKAPFITYRVVSSANFHADNKVLLKQEDIDIELTLTRPASRD